VRREHGPNAPPGPLPAPSGTLETALVAGARDGRIPCGVVFRIAAAEGVPVAEAGRAVQRLGIKITGCQLGCFP
jgi:hypothetical protein